jgi:RimJ/RimL family protein N-acetyltransferase
MKLLFDLDDDSPLFDIRLDPAFRGMGLGFQAVNWLTDYLFRTWPNLLRIEGTTREDNLAMRKVFRKCYYAKEGHYRKAWATSSGDLLDTVQYGILREDWGAKKVTPLRWNDEPQGS